MATIVFRLTVGCVFVLFGRWAYRNPERLYPSSFYTNPDSPSLVKMARAFALLLILVGCFSILSVATERLTNGIVEAFIALGFAVVATWYLLPRISGGEPGPRRPGGFLTRRGKRFVGISLALSGFTIAVIVFVFLRR